MLSPTQFLACLLLLSSAVSASVSETKESQPALAVAASAEPAEAKSAPAAPIEVKTSQASATHIAQVARPSQSMPNVHYEQAMVYARPSSGQASVSLGQLMNGLYSTLSKRMSRRSGKGSALDLYNTLQQGANDYNLGNLNLNDVLNSAMANNAQFASSLQASGLASQLNTLGKGKKLLDLPKQFYKTLGEKISGAGEAAAMATVPLKDSFMNTLKSFYSYIKPARSSQAEAPAAASPSSADPGTAASSMFNFKRRTSEIHPYYQQQQQQFNKNGMTLEQFLYNGGSFGAGYPAKQQAEGMIMEASMPDFQAHLQAQQQQLSRGASKSMAPHPGHPNELIKQQQQQQSNLGQLEYLRPEIIGNDQIYGQFIAQQPSQGLYQKSKEFFSKISRRRFGQSNGNILKQQQQAAVAAMNPGYMFASAPVETIMQQPQQGLSGQTIAKVQSKLGSLPSVYNTNLQQQQQSQVSSVSSPSSSNSLVASASQPQASWAVAVAKPKRPIASYYTHQPSYHYPGQYIKTKQQQTQQVNFPAAQGPATLAETSSSSSTQSPAMMLSTSTSIVSSISVHNEEANEPSEDNADNHGIKDKNDATLFYYDESHLTGGADDAAAKHLDHADDQQESRSSSN